MTLLGKLKAFKCQNYVLKPWSLHMYTFFIFIPYFFQEITNVSRVEGPRGRPPEKRMVS